MVDKEKPDKSVNLSREQYNDLLARAGLIGNKPASSTVPPAPSESAPKKSETRRRTKCLPVRLTPFEHEKLQRLSAQSGLKMGAFVRKMALGDEGEGAQKEPPPDQQLLASILGQIGKIGSNANQLAKRANTDGFGSIAPSDLKELMESISNIRAMLMVALGK